MQISASKQLGQRIRHTCTLIFVQQYAVFRYLNRNRNVYAQGDKCIFLITAFEMTTLTTSRPRYFKKTF